MRAVQHSGGLWLHLGGAVLGGGWLSLVVSFGKEDFGGGHIRPNFVKINYVNTLILFECIEANS